MKLALYAISGLIKTKVKFTTRYLLLYIQIIILFRIEMIAGKCANKTVGTSFSRYYFQVLQKVIL